MASFNPRRDFAPKSVSKYTDKLRSYVGFEVHDQAFWGPFFVSGFCGPLYQIVWIRLAFASFGIITPVLSVVISVFMLGLSLGAWAGGKWIESLTQKTGISAMFFYGLAEVLIGVGAFVVPRFFSIGENSL